MFNMATSLAGSVWDRQSLRSDFSTVSGIGHLIHAGDEQQRRSLRVMNNVVLQAEAEAQAQAAAESRRLQREARLAEITRARAEEAAALADAAREAEAHRKARMEAAARDEQAVRDAARAQVMREEERLDRFAEEKAAKAAQNAERAAAVAARREEAARSSLQQEEAKRAMFQNRQAMADEMVRHREEVRQLELEIKAEKEYLKQVARDAAKEKAEHELAERTASLMQRSAEKDRMARGRLREMRQLVRVKQREAQERHEYNRLKAMEAAEQDAAARDRLRARLDAKAARCDELAAVRAELSQQLAGVRHTLAMQEASMRSSLDVLRRSGAAFRLPPEVSASLTRLRESQLAMMGGSASVPGSTFASPMTTPRTAGAAGASGLRFGDGTPADNRRTVSPSPLPAYRVAAAARPRSASAAPRTPAYLTNMASPSPRGARVMKTAAGRSPRGAYPFTNLHGSPAGAAMGAPSTQPQVHKRVRPRSAVEAEKAGMGPRVTGAAANAPAPADKYTTRGGSGSSALARREEELRVVLREEIDKETERQAVLAGAGDERERGRLNKLFTLEREAAKRRILTLSAAVHAAAATRTAAPAAVKGGSPAAAASVFTVNAATSPNPMAQAGDSKVHRH